MSRRRGPDRGAAARGPLRVLYLLLRTGEDGPGATMEELAASVGKTERQVQNYLGAVRAAGFVTSQQGDRYWALPPGKDRVL